jgi:DNA helicase II / ATP-dependent DNA helicase PcrA
MFPVLLHPDLYRWLRRSGRAERARVWKTLRRLRDGHWSGGTRVKRLRGIGRPVYEARTDAGDRLLFTIVRSALADDPQRLASHLQIWDLVVHDDAERTARRNPSPEAEFLELETLEEFEIDEPPPHPDAAFSEVSAEASAEGDQADPLLQFLLPEGSAPEPREGIPGGVRWFRLAPAVLAGEEEFQRLFDQGGEELELKLTREQYEILAAPGPVLLAGSAGSGKTTVAAHRLAAAVSFPGSTSSNAPSALYLSYSAPLVEHARSLVADLLRSRGEDPDRNPPDFFTFGDLYRSLIPREFREHQARAMTEELFREWFRKSGRALDPALVWEELRSILKGSCLSPSRPMLDEAAYFELGRKRAPLFVNERPEIYRIAQRYQEWLAEEGRSDRIDLCRRAFAESRHHGHHNSHHNKGRRWDVVVCDEVQDLTELEVAFVLSLSARPDLSGVLLTGDTQQIVNPSGFRWAEVRRLAGKTAHAKAAPSVVRLRRNLRSVRPLVELANALLLLRREVYGRTEEDDPEEATIEGPVPIEVAGAEEEVLAAIAGFGPRCAVLTLDDEETERLRRRLGTTRVFHVREAKGLEFETVVLWRLLAPDRDLVDRFCRGDSRLEREPRFRRLLQYLYVAATRARRHLAVYEGPARDLFWNLERFRGTIEPEVTESLAHLFHPTASPADWAREGDYFLARGRFRQAAECYRRAGLPKRELEALAQAGEEQEDWSGALDLWSRLGDPARQAPLLERLGRLEEALFLYHRLGLPRQARICELRLLERRKAWAEAAAGWEELGLLKDAARGWERAGEETRALEAGARAAEEEGDWLFAGAAWLELGRYEEAVRCFRRADDRTRTALALALHHEALGDWARAAAAFRCAGQPEKSARCRARAQEEAGRPERAARTWERLGETERAFALFVQAGEWLEVARLEGVQPESRQRVLARVRELMDAGVWEEAGQLARARMEALRPRLPQLPWFVFVEKERLVWQEYCSLQILEKRSDAQRAEAAGAWSRAARLWTDLGDAARTAEARRRWIETVRDPVRQARAWVAAGEPGRAVKTLEAAGNGAGLAEATVAAWQAERDGRWSEAAALWRSIGRGRDESRCLARVEKAFPADSPTQLPDSGPGDET